MSLIDKPNADDIIANRNVMSEGLAASVEHNRLRRLDALFAENVLGCNVETDANGPRCRCSLEQQHNEWDNCCGDRFNSLSKYTRSLDAAWSGIDSAQFFALVSHSDNPDRPRYRAKVSTAGREHVLGDPFANGDGASSVSPAEALVLACLRAVGVPESDLA